MHWEWDWANKFITCWVDRCIGWAWHQIHINPQRPSPPNMPECLCDHKLALPNLQTSTFDTSWKKRTTEIQPLTEIIKIREPRAWAPVRTFHIYVFASAACWHIHMLVAPSSLCQIHSNSLSRPWHTSNQQPHTVYWYAALRRMPESIYTEMHIIHMSWPLSYQWTWSYHAWMDWHLCL